MAMGTNIQYNGHFPGYYSPRDLIFGAEGSSWTSSNGNCELKNNCYHIGSLPLSSSCHHLAYNKELLKQTILKHEAVFRDQIHELHRVYQKQRELMDEIKRNQLYKHNLRLEASWSSSPLCYSSNLPRSTGQSSVLIAESIRLPLASAQEKRWQTCPAITPAPTAIKEILKDSKPSESTYRKVGNKILDLQLPADEYIDSECGSLENERVSEMHETSQVVCNSDEKPHGASCNGFADLNVPFMLEEETPFPDLCKRTKLGSHNFPDYVIQNSSKGQDLEDFSDGRNPNQARKHGQLYLSNSAGRNGGVLDSLAKSKFNGTERQSVSAESLSKKLEQVNSFPCFQPLYQNTPAPWSEGYSGTQGCTISGWLGPYKLVSTNCTKSSVLSSSVLCKTIESGSNLDSQNYLNSCDNHGSSSASQELRKYVQGSEGVGTPKNINLNFMPAGYSDTTEFQSIQVTREEDKFEDSRLPWLKEKLVPNVKPNEESDLSRDKTLAFDINGKTHAAKVFQDLSKNQCVEEILKIPDVNSPVNHTTGIDMGEQIPAGEQFMENKKTKHEHSAGIIDLNSCLNEDENTAMDIDLKAPASPENKECSPPRGESDENQVEMPFPLAGQEEDSQAREEQARVAAEALVSISGVAANGLQMTTSLPSESFVSGPLQWFAGIVSTIVDHSENEINVDGNTDDLEKYLPADFDYFEFKTLNLMETKVLDCCYKSSGQIELEEGGSTSPTKQPRKRWMNRGRRGKDFRNQILPGLASLSRHEVTEDLQTIVGLVESATGTHSVTGYVRSAGRNVSAKGKKRSFSSASNITDLLLMVKQLNSSDTELGVEKRGLISWGNICRKRRGQRFPISKSPIYFEVKYIK